eukprot:g17676.t1
MSSIGAVGEGTPEPHKEPPTPELPTPPGDKLDPAVEALKASMAKGGESDGDRKSKWGDARVGSGGASSHPLAARS